jgi:hypothetical protein
MSRGEDEMVVGCQRIGPSRMHNGAITSIVPI